MMLLKWLRAVVVSTAVLALYPSLASAQSAIAGQVRDNTGALLPGAVVEASSPALIEGRRSAVTDGQGHTPSSICGRACTRSPLTRRLQPDVREGIQLPANFTATIDITLSLIPFRRP